MRALTSKPSAARSSGKYKPKLTVLPTTRAPTSCRLIGMPCSLAPRTQRRRARIGPRPRRFSGHIFDAAPKRSPRESSPSAAKTAGNIGERALWCWVSVFGGQNRTAATPPEGQPGDLPVRAAVRRDVVQVTSRVLEARRSAPASLPRAECRSASDLRLV